MGSWQTNWFLWPLLATFSGVVFALPFLLSAFCVPLYGLSNSVQTSISQLRKTQHLLPSALYATRSTSEWSAP